MPSELEFWTPSDQLPLEPWQNETAFEPQLVPCWYGTDGSRRKLEIVHPKIEEVRLSYTAWVLWYMTLTLTSNFKPPNPNPNLDP